MSAILAGFYGPNVPLMTSDSDLEQRLWLLVEGRLPRQEVERLHRLITSDPAAARLYAEVKLQSELSETIAGRSTAQGFFSSWLERAWPRGSAARDGDAPRPTLAKTLQLVTLLLAAGLLAVPISLYLRADSPIGSAGRWEQRLLDDYYTTQITGPSQLTTVSDRASRRVSVSTRSLDGRPRSARLDFHFLDQSGDVLQKGSVLTDGQGRGRIALPPHAPESLLILEASSRVPAAGKLRTVWHPPELLVDVATQVDAGSTGRSVRIQADVHDPTGKPLPAVLTVLVVDGPLDRRSGTDSRLARLSEPFTMTDAVSVRKGIRQAFVEGQTRRSGLLTQSGLVMIILGIAILLIQAILGLLAWHGPRRLWLPTTMVASLCLLVGIGWGTARVTRAGHLVVGPITRRPSPTLAAVLEDATGAPRDGTKAPRDGTGGTGPSVERTLLAGHNLEPLGHLTMLFSEPQLPVDESGHAELQVPIPNRSRDIWVLVEARAAGMTGRSALHVE